MSAGRFRDRVEFQRKTSSGQTAPSDATDEYGNPIDDMGNSTGEFAHHLTIRADIRETPGRERIANGAVESTRTATIRVRACAATAAITPADRLLARGEIWNIRSGPIRVKQTPRILEFLCETGVAT
ncbi:MAG: head-tail adaptor protein [Salipiger thiooxidans]|uniref:head-tail adaptor protein n=1 Tax=Salipiger thiooxidans TaxID=282683 RepID=UPI001CF9CA2B|nr:head-tail adaptor protein [Salipiger thiooxidans]